MDTSVTVALIKGAAMVVAAGVAILPKLMRPTDSTRVASPTRAPGAVRDAAVRTVYYQGTRHRFLNFRGKNCRIQSLAGGESFKAPTHELFHDAEQNQPITRETIVVNP